MPNVTSRKNLRFVIPKELQKLFIENPRIVLDPAPGLWPVDIKMISRLENLIKDKEFDSKFEVLIVPR